MSSTDKELEDITGASSPKTTKTSAGTSQSNPKVDLANQRYGAKAGSPGTTFGKTPFIPKGSQDSLFPSRRAIADAAGKALPAGGLKKGESNGLYKGFDPENEGKGFRAKLKGMNRYRKLAAAGGSGGLMSLIIAFVVIAPIYRIPSLMQMIGQKTDLEIQHIIEKRSEKYLLGYVLRKAGGDSTKWVITGSPISDLFQTFQSRQVEKLLAARTGITFSRDSQGVVHLLHDGTDLGGVKNIDDVQKLIDGGTVKTVEDFKTILSSMFKSSQAGPFANQLRLRYLKGSFGVPKASEDPDPHKAAADDLKGIQQQELETSDPVKAVVPALGCITEGEAGDSGDCQQFEEEDPEAQATPDTGVTSESGGSLDDVKGALTSAESTAENQVLGNEDANFIDTFLNTFQTALEKMIGSQAADELPLIGEVNIASQFVEVFDHLTKITTPGGENLLEEIPATVRGMQYASQNALWRGYADAIKAAGQDGINKVSAGQLSAMESQVGNTVDEAASWKYIAGDSAKDAEATGVPVSPKIGADTLTPAEEVVTEISNNPFFKVLESPLQFWYNTVGKLLNTISNTIIGGFFSYILKISGFQTLFSNSLKAIFGPDWQKQFIGYVAKMIMTLLGGTIDPLAKNAALMNNLYAGGEYASNTYCKIDLGCRKSTPKKALMIQTELQKFQNQLIAETPLKDRLFSTNVSNSLINNLIIHAPSSAHPSDIMASVFSSLGKLPLAIISAFSPRIQAQSYDINDAGYLTGSAVYYASDDDLNQGLDPTLGQQTGTPNCPTVSGDTVNLCVMDETIINGLNCWSGGAACTEFRQQ